MADIKEQMRQLEEQRQALLLKMLAATTEEARKHSQVVYDFLILYLAGRNAADDSTGKARAFIDTKVIPEILGEHPGPFDGWSAKTCLKFIYPIMANFSSDKEDLIGILRWCAANEGKILTGDDKPCYEILAMLVPNPFPEYVRIAREVLRWDNGIHFASMAEAMTRSFTKTNTVGPTIVIQYVRHFLDSKEARQELAVEGRVKFLVVLMMALISYSPSEQERKAIEDGKFHAPSKPSYADTMDASLLTEAIELDLSRVPAADRDWFKLVGILPPAKPITMLIDYRRKNSVGVSIAHLSQDDLIKLFLMMGMAGHGHAHRGEGHGGHGHDGDGHDHDGDGRTSGKKHSRCYDADNN